MATEYLTPKFCLNNIEGTFDTLKKSVDKPILPGAHTGLNVLTDFWSWGYSFWDDEEDFLERLTEAAKICADADYFYVGSHHIKAWMDYYVIQCLKSEEKFKQVDDVYSVFSVDMSNCGNKVGNAGLTFGGSGARRYLWAVYDVCTFIDHAFCPEPSPRAEESRDSGYDSTTNFEASTGYDTPGYGTPGYDTTGYDTPDTTSGYDRTTGYDTTGYDTTKKVENEERVEDFLSAIPSYVAEEMASEDFDPSKLITWYMKILQILQKSTPPPQTEGISK